MVRPHRTSHLAVCMTLTANSPTSPHHSQDNLPHTTLMPMGKTTSLAFHHCTIYKKNNWGEIFSKLSLKHTVSWDSISNSVWKMKKKKGHFYTEKWDVVEENIRLKFEFFSMWFLCILTWMLVYFFSASFPTSQSQAVTSQPQIFNPAASGASQHTPGKCAQYIIRDI